MPAGLSIRLRPTGPWRIGPDSGDRDRVERVYHSDTLYSAVSSAMARLGMLEEWLDATARASSSGVVPAVRFSSCFPFNGDTLYVTPPRSLWPPLASSKVRWKGARFAPLTLIQGMLTGKPVSEEGWAVDGASETLITMGTQGPFRVAVRSSAAVDRGGEGVEPHSSACLEFAPHAGLWMTAAFADDQAREKWKGSVTAALRLLADSGFGGERSRGWGRADVEFSDQHSPLVAAAADPAAETAWWMLSLYHPAPDDAIDWRRGNYSLTTRSGRAESGEGWGASETNAKRLTRMITEGSVLAAPSQPRGSVTDVAPEGFPHPVYRAGYALAIPIPLRPPVMRELPREVARAAPKEAPVETLAEIPVEAPAEIPIEAPAVIPEAAAEEAPQAKLVESQEAPAEVEAESPAAEEGPEALPEPRDEVPTEAPDAVADESSEEPRAPESQEGS
ncbi:MAG TPA: type III-A CRISPR-associated RAMP protein Csm4 [Bryobacteraceae bacterium]|jgi:CRISPR type III-A-associated RAMP protein Csm4